MDYEDDFLFEEDKMGMTVTSGNVVIQKDSSNLIGISIGGGAPLCPCLYVVQIFDNTPASLDGTLEAGDELVSINGQSLKGKTKVEVAKIIQSCEGSVSINYNKLHADLEQGRTLDIILKKVKHRLVENMGSATADALGLSRAILCNDTLVQRLSALEKTENLYKGLVQHAKSTLHAYYDIFQIYKVFGDAFASMGVKEPQHRASEAFTKFGEQHRQMEKLGINMLQALKPILSDLGTYLNKAIPDTRMTISKYADAKFEYLSYCLKVKELDDEEQSYLAIQEPLYRIETGNYEYRLVLRCRQNARKRFAKLRSDVLVKLELLYNKHVDDVVTQLRKYTIGLADYYMNIAELLSENIFPVEIDLSQSTFQKPSNLEPAEYEDDDENCVSNSGADDQILSFDIAEEAVLYPDSTPSDLKTKYPPPHESCNHHHSRAENVTEIKGTEDLRDLIGLISSEIKNTEEIMSRKIDQLFLIDAEKERNLLKFKSQNLNDETFKLKDNISDTKANLSEQKQNFNFENKPFIFHDDNSTDLLFEESNDTSPLINIDIK